MNDLSHSLPLQYLLDGSLMHAICMIQLQTSHPMINITSVSTTASHFIK